MAKVIQLRPAAKRFWTPERKALAFSLYNRGLSYVRIAERVGTTDDAVKVEIRRARKDLERSRIREAEAARARRNLPPPATEAPPAPAKAAPTKVPKAESNTGLPALDMLATARSFLNKGGEPARLTYKGSQAYLDGVPVNLDTWMKEAGRVRGIPFGKNPNWDYRRKDS